MNDMASVHDDTSIKQALTEWLSDNADMYAEFKQAMDNTLGNPLWYSVKDLDEKELTSIADRTLSLMQSFASGEADTEALFADAIANGDTHSYCLCCYLMLDNGIETIKESFSRQEKQQEAATIAEGISSGEMTKVVSSREVEFTSDTPYNVASILANLVDNNPNCFIFGYEKDGRTFVGASPEILVRHRGSEILSYALAGTAPKHGPKAWTKEQLLTDKKNLFEHNIVRDRIVNTMKAITPDVTIGETGIMELAHLYHLRTIITAKDSTKSLVEWAKLLHPTPALGGEPRGKALALLQTYEAHERGMYAAPFGFMKDVGDGIVVVAIRSALIMDNVLYAYAGCGVVADSDADEEYAETNNKMRTILDAL